MRFPPHLLDEIRARLPVSQVVGRKVALKKKGREWAGLSPFKTEKTPSFFVNDQKGFYHCFASGEHGDVFTFLMKTEGLSFLEAVERLAGEAGVALPKPEPRQQEAHDHYQRLAAVLEASAAFFEQSLAGAQGVEARRYLERRGVRRETIAAFRLGYAPAGRNALGAQLAKLGFSAEEQAQSGMLISGEDIREPYDRFRHRVMFPISDARGRIIAFGGRALDPAAPAKYLNSPETALFHKGRNLYNAHKARFAAHDRSRVIAVEGYMDVVALTEAGFAEAVAPLGTALTAEQIGLLWRMSPEPILCFDGDTAGRKAAERAVDVVLPLLQPGKSLRFAFLPDGLDPDDLVRQQGPAALESILASAEPLAAVLFNREWSQGEWTTPERRAGLEKQLRLHVARIEEPTVRGHYQREMLSRLNTSWAADRGRGGNWRTTSSREPASEPWRGSRPREQRAGGRPYAPGAKFEESRRGLSSRYTAAGAPPRGLPSASLLKSGLVSGEAARPNHRELLLIRTLLNHVWLVDQVAEDVARLPLAAPALSTLRDAILAAVSLDNSLDSVALRSHLTSLGLGGLISLVDRLSTHKCDRFAEPDAGHAEVEAGWRHALALHERQVGLRAALHNAEQAWHEDRDEDAFQRICELQAELHVLGRPDDAGLDSEPGDATVRK